LNVILKHNFMYCIKH